MQFTRMVLVSAMFLLFACGQPQEDGSAGGSAGDGTGFVATAESESSAESEATPPRPNVSDEDAAAMAANDFGTPVARAGDRIEVRRWVQDGGGVVTVEAAAGRRLVIVEFPHASNPSGRIFFHAPQVLLDAGGAMTGMFAVTGDGANAPKLGRTEDGRRVYKREVQASTYTPTPDLSFAVVFEVPASASHGTLWLGRRSVPLSW